MEAIVQLIQNEALLSGLYVVAAFALVVVLANAVNWSKKLTKGAMIFMAIFPVISIFPIPQQEIKKIENIKKEYVKKHDENGEPIDELEQDV